MLDLLLKNVRTINGERLEIAIQDGKFKEIGKNITTQAKNVITLEDNQMVSAGWIDSHVHCYEKMSLYYDFPDEIGIKKGVTTIVDAGSSGENNIRDFYEMSQKANTNVFALMNISKNGIVTQDELADLSNINQSKNLERINELSEFIIGIKARMSKTVVGQNNVEPLKLAKKLQKLTSNLPLMVHIGSAPPKLIDVLNLLEKNDIVTHCYNGKPNGILDSDNEIKEFVRKAYDRGIIFDVGHGTDSFNFNVGKVAVEKGLLPKSVSTDIYHRNRENGPVYDLATTIEKMLLIGITLQDAIEMVTINPAKMFHLSQKGKIEKGLDGDLTIFTLTSSEVDLVDSNNNHQKGSCQIRPSACVVGGKFYQVKEDSHGHI